MYDPLVSEYCSHDRVQELQTNDKCDLATLTEYLGTKDAFNVSNHYEKLIPICINCKQTLPCFNDPKEARCRCTPGVWKPTPQHPDLARTRTRLIITVRLFGRGYQFQYGGQLFDVGVDRGPQATTQLATKFLYVPRTAIEYKYGHDEVMYRQVWSTYNAVAGDYATPQVGHGSPQITEILGSV